jgi:hypothetical protein
MANEEVEDEIKKAISYENSKLSQQNEMIMRHTITPLIRTP